MTKSFNKKPAGIILTLAIVIILSVNAFGSAPPTGAQITDIYSPWAENDVFMARDVYNLGNEGTYSNFRGNLTGYKFSPVVYSLCAAFKSDYKFDYDGDAPMTREQVITVLYSALTDNMGTEISQAETLDYFIGAGLIYGRSPEDYQLNDICTVEEMIAFSARVYNHGIYEAGKYSTGFFWEAEGAGNTVYLLGSIHLSDDSIYPMSKAIETAFARSDNIVVEADILEMSSENILFIAEKALINPLSGETIADYISGDTYALYVDVCVALDTPASFYNYLKPWMAYNYLNLLLMSEGDMQAMEENAASGIDMYFLEKGTILGKNVIQLESFEQQINMLASFSPELQEMMLLEVLQTAGGVDAGNDFDEQPVDFSAFLQQALDAIKAGDEAAVIALFGIDAESDDPLLAEYSQKMMTDRDAAMAEKIAGFLEEEAYNGDYFVVVGAAHLLSKDSVIAQLIEMGYTVERIR